MDVGRRMRYGSMAASVVVSILVVVSLTSGLLFDRALVRAGRADLTSPGTVIGIIAAAIASALIVGVALVLRRPDHPVGWLFLALAAAIALTGITTGYAVYGAVARPGSLPGADFVAYVDSATFLSWLAIVALVLHLTPTGRTLSRRWGLIARGTVAAAAVAALCTLFSPRPLDPPLEEVANPIAIDGLRGPLSIGQGLGAMLTGAGLLAAAASMLVRYRRSTGVERKQLLWLSLAAAPLPLFVPAAFVAAAANDPVPLLIATGGWIVVVPVAAGLAITQYHLYEVERILSRTLTYVLLTVVVAVTYVSVVVMAGRGLAGLAGSSTIAVVLGTLAAVSIASPARRSIQDGLDRRFNRRRFDAMHIVAQHLRRPEDGATIEAVLARALADPTLTISYWVEDRDQWVSSGGHTARPGEHAVEVRRDDRPVARLAFDADHVDRHLVESVAVLAVPELDNARLRAAITLQLVEVNESRARIAAAQIAERRKLERNLHDGAQQRLLGLAFQLQAAQLNGDVCRLREAVADGIDQTQAAVLELRQLANGLHPSVLSDGGLAAAFDDLAARTPVPVDVRSTEDRFGAEVEAAAWFIACEAVANAQKHAAPSSITIDVDHDDDWLTVTVHDDGSGGADAKGAGLQGIRDRAEAAGGSLEVASRPGSGTTVRGRLPCGR